jgi:NADH:ubiquinone oxidoreductase subunit 5 (subunit L)/multisubunit Na+/H+ antiporter MnhA subunit
MSYRVNPQPVFIGLYFVLILLLIVGSIIISNMYEDIYNGQDEMGDRLREQTILSYMILYSPVVMTIIAFITGIYLFTRNEEGESPI